MRYRHSRRRFCSTGNTNSVPAAPRRLAFDQNAMHETGLVQWKIGIGMMHETSIVPNHDITGLPDVVIHELLLVDVHHQFIQKRITRRSLQLDDSFEPRRTEVQGI